jgi:hypothetical protein
MHSLLFLLRENILDLADQHLLQIVAYECEPAVDLAESFIINLTYLDMLGVRECPAYIGIAVSAASAKEERRSGFCFRILIRLQVSDAVGAVLSHVS